MSTNTATLHTSMGDIVIELFPNHAPKTVANFVELATGAKEWTDPRDGKKTTAKLYDGTIFHRVIAGFMIQGGDPLGKDSADLATNSLTNSTENCNSMRHTFLQWLTQDQEQTVHNSLSPLHQQLG